MITLPLFKELDWFKEIDWRKAPTVTVILIVLNCLTYLVYQGGDDEKIQQTTHLYLNDGLFDIEYPHYDSYLHRRQQTEQAALVKQAFQEKELELLSTIMISDIGFSEHLQKKGSILWSSAEYSRWQKLRRVTNPTINSISEIRFGLIPAHNIPLSFVTYQFLHGGLIYLITNMLFLLVLGAAVEQRLGHQLTITIYIGSGICGGLAYTLSQWIGAQWLNSGLDSYNILIGASAAVAGLMGANLSLYGFRKDFITYFVSDKAQLSTYTCWLLLAWLGYEFFVSNTAYWAHAGSFVTGFTIIFARKKWLPKLNLALLGPKDPHLEYRRELAKVMSAIGNMEFTSAKSTLRDLIPHHPRDLSLLEQLYKLEKLDTKNASYQEVVELLFCFPTHDKIQLLAIQEIYKDYKKIRKDRPPLSASVMCSLIIKLCRLNLPEEAEKEVALLLDEEIDKCSQSKKALNALAVCFDKQNNKGKAEHYRSLSAE